jgi:hypothetical protein
MRYNPALEGDCYQENLYRQQATVKNEKLKAQNQGITVKSRVRKKEDVL